MQEPYESDGVLFSKVAGYNLTKKGLTQKKCVGKVPF